MNAIQLNLPLRFDSRALLRCSMPRVRNDLHHLHEDSRGWVLRLSISVAAGQGRVIRKRLRWRLGRITEREAKIRRDASISTLRKVGVDVSERQLVRGVRAE